MTLLELLEFVSEGLEEYMLYRHNQIVDKRNLNIAIPWITVFGNLCDYRIRCSDFNDSTQSYHMTAVSLLTGGFFRLTSPPMTDPDFFKKLVRMFE